MITDGSPNNQNGVKGVLRDAASSIQHDNELSVSFIQIGDDSGAARFLKELDDNLNAKFDIVDTLAFTDMKAKGMTFEQLIAQSVHD